VPGKPDVAFVSKKVAIFVDGHFWHGYKFNSVGKKLPRKYWLPKIRQNMLRDRKINRILKQKGWKVLRFWEHEVTKKPERVLMQIITILDDNYDLPLRPKD